MADRSELETLRRQRAALDAQISVLEGGDGPAAEDASAAGDTGDIHERIAAAEKRADWAETSRLKAKLIEFARKGRGL